MALTQLRQRISALLANSKLLGGMRVLDYGCGNRPYEPLFKDRYGEYVAADLPGNDRADLLIDDQGRIPVADAVFDGVLSSQVLEHVRDPHAYLRESYRVLRPGGSLLLSTHGFWRYHPDPEDYRRWTPSGLRLELERVGYETLVIQGVLGLASTSVLLWQDATCVMLPRMLRPLYYASLQGLIRLIEALVDSSDSSDAAVFVVVARKPA